MTSTSTIMFLLSIIGAMSALPIAHVNQTEVGGCLGTYYGCCSDNTSYCMNMNCSTCVNVTRVIMM